MVDGAERHRGLLHKRKRLVARVNCYYIKLSGVSAVCGGFACGMCTGVVLWTQGSTLHALAHRRAEGGRVLGGMVLRRRRMRGCRRELMCWRRAQTMRRTAVHAALHRTSFGRTEAAAEGPGGSIQAAAARRTAAATDSESRWSRPRDRLAATKTRFACAAKAQGCAFCETGVCVLSKVPRLRFKVKRSVMRRDA